MIIKTHKINRYIIPSVDLLKINTNLKLSNNSKKEIIIKAEKLEKTLLSFGIEAKVIKVTKGPLITIFELQLKDGLKISEIVNLRSDIALRLAAKDINIEASIIGKSAIAIEIPNEETTPVFFREVLESHEFKNNNYKIACALGKDMTGKCVIIDLNEMPHILIAGAVESDKNICIDTFIISILYKYSPEEVKFLMIDPRMIELNVYNGIPHLLIPIVTDSKKAVVALSWVVSEITRRYKLFMDNGIRNIDSYNGLAKKGFVDEKLPSIVIIIEELVDLMMAYPKEIEDLICKLAQRGKAAGIHLIIGTQTPSYDVITRPIKANIPSKISFVTSSHIGSRIVLDSVGAEKLLGKGDMLFYPVGEPHPKRVQGALISEEEVENIIYFIKNAEVDKCEKERLENTNSNYNNSSKDKEDDELLDKAINIAVEAGQVSTSYLQRRLKIGFNRSVRIVEMLEENGIISHRDGNKPRQVLISKEELKNMR